MTANTAGAQRQQGERNSPAPAGPARNTLAVVAPVQRQTRRGRKPAIDPKRTQELGDQLEPILGPGWQLIHSHRMGWRLRQWDSWIDREGHPKMAWLDIDEAPDGQLGALLLRHQRRVRGL